MSFSVSNKSNTSCLLSFPFPTVPMATCCLICLTILPSLIFWSIGLVVGGLSGLCTSERDRWAMGLYLVVNMVYVLNIVASFDKVEDFWGGAWLPSLWGRFRWLGVTVWMFDLWCLGYFLWTHHPFGFSPSSSCLHGQYHDTYDVGYIGIVGMTGIGLLHFLTVLLWKMCKPRHASQTTSQSEPLLPFSTTGNQPHANAKVYSF